MHSGMILPLSNWAAPLASSWLERLWEISVIVTARLHLVLASLCYAIRLISGSLRAVAVIDERARKVFPRPGPLSPKMAGDAVCGGSVKGDDGLPGACPNLSMCVMHVKPEPDHPGI